MSEMVIMPRADAQAIWDKVREKTGATGPLLSSEIAPLMDEITGGGGGIKEIIPETSLPFVEYNGGAYVFELPDPTQYTLKEGGTYTVIWNGEKYVCECKMASITLEGETKDIGLIIGNAGIGATAMNMPGAWPDSGEPFVVVGDTAGNVAYILTMSTDETHTIRVYTEIQSGGSSDDVRYVTFMSEDGTTELLKKAVATGDDCADVIARGLIETPTKDATAQYSYTYTGWALAAGGAADADALKSVTEDRIVYAAFKAALQYYTITYNDSDGTLLKSESLAYGSTPTYTPAKEGYNFDSWTPALATVTGPATYTASWAAASLHLADYTWAELIELSNNGQGKQFVIGETKTFKVYNQEYTAKLIGTNQDDLADGTGKAGMTFKFMRPRNSNGNSDGSVTLGYSDDNSVNWGTTTLRTAFNRPSGSLGLWLNMESDLRAGIKTVTKKYYDFNTASILTTSDKMWIESLSELGFESGYDEGACYPVYTDEKTLTDTDAELAMDYVMTTRSKLESGVDTWYAIDTNGKPGKYNQAVTNVLYAYPCFCI